MRRRQAWLPQAGGFSPAGQALQEPAHGAAEKECHMKLPKQSRAVERKVNRLAAGPAGQKVSPSGWFDDVMDVVRTVGPIASTIAGAV